VEAMGATVVAMGATAVATVAAEACSSSVHNHAP